MGFFENVFEKLSLLNHKLPDYEHTKFLNLHIYAPKGSNDIIPSKIASIKRKSPQSELFPINKLPLFPIGHKGVLMTESSGSRSSNLQGKYVVSGYTVI